jgi:hypothetical protein
MRRIFKKSYFISIAVFVLLIMSCRQKEQKEQKEATLIAETTDFEVSDFNALSNISNRINDSTHRIELKYFDAINTGFIIPAEGQVNGDKFICRFKIRNKSAKPQKYFYKIFYQNESYKFPETDSLTKEQSIYAHENFYGSWEDTTQQFKKTLTVNSDNEFHEIVDSIRIVGNPRNERLYFKDGVNNRWKRNPRTGLYSFLLVVTDEANIAAGKIPVYAQSVSAGKDGNFVHPYHYFLAGEGSKLQNTLCLYSANILKVVAKPDLGTGIYYESRYFGGRDSRAVNNMSCGNDTNLFRSAAFEQFQHYIDASTRLENIPVIADVLKDNYSKRDYNWNRGFYKKEELIGGTPMIAKTPCETVYSDPVNKKIVIRNPKTTPGKWKKENVGVISRHGFAYGKIRVKAKLTELLNKNNMWNGLTNAIWLINQGGEESWNFRRTCGKEGYMATYWGGDNDKRVPKVGYSEIDFEILKTPPYCPDQTFPPVYKNPTNNPKDISSWNTPLPDEILIDDGNITVACTNWDMACWEPENFGVGCNQVKYEGQVFEAHRWNHWYRAITEKTQASDDELFASPYYYFEIDWRPMEIIWRIGPEPDRMKVVGYMNDKMTSIPNNQMLLIVTQEFHNTQWWPGSPYQQKNIPFPLNDIFGEILEVTIE